MRKAARKQWLKYAGIAGATVLLGAVVGCDKEDQYTLVFSHFNHIDEYGLECSDCHYPAENGAMPPINHDTCVDCHDDWIEEEPSKYTCGSCHQVKDLDALAEQEIPEPPEPVLGVFVHTEALDDRCAECHGKLFDEDLEHVPVMKRSEIVAMRDEAHASGMDCTACHVDMDPDTPPPSHDRNWMPRHGEFGSALDNACSVCHSEQSCSECHQEMMPRSHNDLWRLKTHGIEAAWDMDRCQVCHMKESCDACHQEVAPQSHSAGWERRHCLECHFSQDSGTGCALCHEGARDMHPSPHQPGFERNHCVTCHEGTGPAGDLCTVCHDMNSLREHPNPHSGGWRSSHCDRCHEGEVEGVSCAACHGSGYAQYHVNPHSAGFRDSHCYSCHPGSQSDEECGICHEGAGSVLVHEDFWPPVHDLFGEAGNCFDCHY